MLGTMPHIMAKHIQQLNKQYQVNYVERMSYRTQDNTYHNMLLEFPSFFFK